MGPHEGGPSSSSSSTPRCHPLHVERGGPGIHFPRRCILLLPLHTAAYRYCRCVLLLPLLRTNTNQTKNTATAALNRTQDSRRCHGDPDRIASLDHASCVMLASLDPCACVSSSIQAWVRVSYRSLTPTLSDTHAIWVWVSCCSLKPTSSDTHAILVYYVSRRYGQISVRCR